MIVEPQGKRCAVDDVRLAPSCLCFHHVYSEVVGPGLLLKEAVINE